MDHVDQHTDEFRSLIVEKNRFLVQKLKFASDVDWAVLLSVLHVWLAEILICFSCLNVLKTFAALIEPQVNQFLCHDSELSHDQVGALPGQSWLRLPAFTPTDKHHLTASNQIAECTII